MRKIKEVVIKNFQVHRDRTFEFDDYTAIVGQSDKGKTAILRAINWALYNSPTGNSFITRGEDTCSVIVKFDDGLEIKRTKGSKENSYDIKFQDNTSIHLEAFGVGAVDEVVEAHGMREIDIFGDKQALNVCRQLDEPFFLGESPTNKAMIIGKLAKTEVIDLAIKNTSSDIRQKKAINKEYKEKLKIIKAEQSTLKGLSTLEKALNFSEKKLEALTYLNMKIESIKSIVGKIDNLTEQKDKLNNIALNGVGASEILELVDKGIEILTSIESIKKTVDSLNLNINKFAECKRICDKASPECLDEIINKVDYVINLSNNTNTIKLKANKLISETKKLESLKLIPKEDELIEVAGLVEECADKLETISKIKEVNKKFKFSEKRRDIGKDVISRLNSEYENKVNEYKEELKESQECPTCGSSLKDISDIDKITGDL